MRLHQMFDSFLKAFTVTLSFGVLHDFVVLDQFPTSVLPDIRHFIIKPQVTDLTTDVEKADVWVHKAYPNRDSSGVSSKSDVLN